MILAKNKPKIRRVAKPKGELPARKPEGKKEYFSGVGRRKMSIARARIIIDSSRNKTKENEDYMLEVNQKTTTEYFSVTDLREIAISPLKMINIPKKLLVSVQVKGGGIRGQAEATRLSIARALVKYDNDLKKPLRDVGYLTRDDRIVERKKAGLKKARRAPQWKKR